MLAGGGGGGEELTNEATGRILHRLGGDRVFS